MSKATAKPVTEQDRVFRAMDAATETIRNMTTTEAVALAVRAGILTKEGKLAEPYLPQTPPQPRRSRRAEGKVSRRSIPTPPSPTRGAAKPRLG